MANVELVIPAKAGFATLVIPVKAGFSTAELVIQFLLGSDLESRASTPPAEERVTSFFARAKKAVTKKESTLRGSQGGSAHAGSKSLRRWQLRVRRGSISVFQI
jgi:hypothetical protein